MGKRERDKGNRGEAEALLVLSERGYTVADLTSGVACEDVLAVKDGTVWCVEVKNRKSIALRDFESQAREQANRRGRGTRWMTMSRLEGYPHTFLVTRQGEPPTVWKGNG